MIKHVISTISYNPCVKCSLYLPKMENGSLGGYECRATEEQRKQCSYDGNWITVKYFTAYHKKTN